MDFSIQLSKKYEIDCQCLYCFSSGIDATDHQKLLEILTNRSLEEIKIIKQLYSTLYNQDLLHLLHSSRRSNALAKVAYLRMSEPQLRDAEIIRNSLFGARVDLNTLIEVICTRSSAELHVIKQSYRSQYNSDTEQDVSTKVQGGFKEILVAVVRSSRNYGGRVDKSMGMCDAKTLYEAMESGRSIDQNTIISLISQRSTTQLKSILDSYKELYGNDLTKSLKRNKCGQFGKDLRVVLRCVQYPEKYFTKKLRRPVNSFDAQEALIRIIVTRFGVDISNVKSAFRSKAGSSLESLVRGEFNKNTSEKANSFTAELLIGLLNLS
ncbi:hypothetical protein ACHQM5_016507 [Ranunculus cassubicifolius]